MGVKDTLLTGLFGEGGHTKAKFSMNGEVFYDHKLESAREIRLDRFRRFGWTTWALYTAVHMYCQWAGLIWDPYDGFWEWFGGASVLIASIVMAAANEASLVVNRKKRAWARELAEFIDDFVEDPANADIMEEPDRSRLKSVAIDFEMYSQDPTQYDKPWWRLRDPLQRRLDN